MRETPKELRIARCKKASDAARKKLQETITDPRRLAVREIVGIFYSAKSRCNNPNNSGFKNYGGRGIKFLFPSASAAAEWVLDNLGPRPDGCSIDRIDNNRHYEPGNLRWATRQEQARNKRAYKGHVYGYRLKKLLALRPDYTTTGLTKFIKMGWSDDQILNHRKGSHVTTSLRHSELRAKKQV